MDKKKKRFQITLETVTGTLSYAETSAGAGRGRWCRQVLDTTCMGRYEEWICATAHWQQCSIDGWHLKALKATVTSDKLFAAVDNIDVCTITASSGLQEASVCSRDSNEMPGSRASAALILSHTCVCWLLYYVIIDSQVTLKYIIKI